MSNNDLAFLLIASSSFFFDLFLTLLIKFLSPSLSFNSVTLKLGDSVKTVLKLLFDIDT